MVSFKSIFSAASVLAAHASFVLAEERPANVTICDYYTSKTVGAVTADNNKLLMALVLHSALLGPFSKYNTVPIDDFTGALAETTFLGEAVDLNPYFNGAYASANTGGSVGEAVNFFGDGGLEAARNLQPSSGNNTSSAQYKFFTHVYSYFGTFLGCTYINTATFPAYEGKASMYEVHKFMDLNWAEMSFFIDQAVRGLVSIGFTTTDAQFVNTTLNSVFNYRCSPAAAVVPASAGPQLQAICVAADCPLSVNDTCPAYDVAVAPAVANATLLGNYTKEANGSTKFNTSATSSSTPASTSTTTSQAGRMVESMSCLMGSALTMLVALSFAFVLV